MKFRQIIEKYLDSRTVRKTYLITNNDLSIEIKSFINETDDYITFESSSDKEYLIMKDKIIGIRNTNKSGTSF